MDLPIHSAGGSSFDSFELVRLHKLGGWVACCGDTLLLTLALLVVAIKHPDHRRLRLILASSSQRLESIMAARMRQLEHEADLAVRK